MPSQRLLAGRVERRHDDVVGLAEAGAEVAEQVVHARIAVRLEHGDDAAAGAGPRRRQHGRDLGRMVGVVVVDRGAVPVAGQLEAALDAGEASTSAARMASSGMPASLPTAMAASALSALCWPGMRNRPAAELPLAAAHARAELGVDDDAAALLRQAAQHEVGAARGAVGEQAAAVAAQLQPLDHVARHRMIDAGDGEAIEGNVAEEGLELAVHVLDRLEVVEVLGVDVGDDADLRRQARRRCRRSRRPRRSSTRPCRGARWCPSPG